MESQAQPDFHLVPTAIPGFKVCFLVQRSGRGVAALPAALGLCEDQQELSLVWADPGTHSPDVSYSAS